ncbi:CD9 antigen-like [Entelurus aequoreus]|uniref:CD9 antigen-like n=1 Tax=Entelurus aequoreus TaxID=161455 RepID=UPI002B1DA41F|nr:CD9 antigen-like [Entelurus aequoreus]
MDCCGSVCKFILIIFNFIFALLAFAFLGLGLWLRCSPNTRAIFEISSFNSSYFVIGVTVLIVLGTVLLLVVVFGDFGVCCEKRCALHVLAVLLFLLAVALMVGGLLIYTNNDTVGKAFAGFYESMYTLYVTTGDPGLRVTIMFIQEMLYCCGLTGIPVLESMVQTCPKPNGFLSHIAMPTCPGVISDTFHHSLPILMVFLFLTGALLITALVCTLILNKKLRKDQMENDSQYLLMYEQVSPAVPV